MTLIKLRCNMRIRLARLTDAPVIAEFNARLAHETEGRRLDARRLRLGVRRLLRDANKGIYFLAEQEGAVVGQLLITFEWSDWRNGYFWWIQSVYVLPEFRGQGVFRALYGHVAKRARARRDVCGLRLYVDQENRRAQRIYQQLGLKAARYKLLELDFVLK